MNTNDYRRFGGISRLFGRDNFEKLQNAHVCIVGVGGVGSWAVEAMARTAIGRITIVDGDTVAESNTNRQSHAMDGNYGLKKVEVLAQRIKAINPAVEVVARDTFVDETNFDEVIGRPDMVLDCIDSLKAKAQLIAWAKKNDIALIVSAGAGGRMDATRVKVDDLARVSGDGLVSALRTNLRKHYGFPKGSAQSKSTKFGFPCVYSDEPVLPSQDGEDGFGVFVGVTAVFGMTMASLAVRALLEK